jgi:hypothetical protein
VSSKCFQLYYTCSDRLLTIALHSYSFHLFPPLTVTFPKLSVVLRPLYLRSCATIGDVIAHDSVIARKHRKLNNGWIDFHAICYGPDAIGSYSKLIICNFKLSVIPACRLLELLRWLDDPPL